MFTVLMCFLCMFLYILLFLSEFGMAVGNFEAESLWDSNLLNKHSPPYLSLRAWDVSGDCGCCI